MTNQRPQMKLRNRDDILARARVAVLALVADGLYAVRRYLLDKPFFTSRVLPAIPRPARWALRKIYLKPADVIDEAIGRRGDMVPPRSEMFVGSVEDFERSGELLVQRLIELAGLTPSASVLDLGSGIGRLAVALTRHLGREGRYEGLDIVASGIEWCAQNITPRHPNFRFTLADVFNGEYNPGGRAQPHEYRLPYDDEAFDLVVLTSVFTHMLPGDVEHYVDEIARVLKPAGRCFATFSLLDGESRRLMDAGHSDTKFTHGIGPAAVVDEKVPELAVAYDEGYVRELFEHRRMPVHGIHYGSWSGRETPEATTGLSQDAVVAVKARAHPG